MSVLTTQNLNIGYLHKGKADIIQTNLQLKLQAGELVCLIGPNGAGKSTLLRTLAGLQKPLSGKVQIDNVDITQISHQKKALQIALVLTDRVEIDNATVRDIVAYGRHPHSNWWGTPTGGDKELVNEAISLVHLDDKAENNINELSDGERQRVMIAKALAQDTPVIMLDEPTAHLDLPNRVEIMLLLHRLAHTTGKAILLSTHELDIALQAADRIWLITKDTGIECGVPEDLVFNGSFSRAFESRAYYFNASNGNFSMNYPLQKKVWVEGDKTRTYWTLRALARAGYLVVPDSEIRIHVLEKSWLVGDGKELFSVKDLLEELERINSQKNAPQ